MTAPSQPIQVSVGLMPEVPAAGRGRRHGAGRLSCSGCSRRRRDAAIWWSSLAAACLRPQARSLAGFAVIQLPYFRFHHRLPVSPTPCVVVAVCAPGRASAWKACPMQLSQTRSTTFVHARVTSQALNMWTRKNVINSGSCEFRVTRPGFCYRHEHVQHQRRLVRESGTALWVGRRQTPFQL